MIILNLKTLVVGFLLQLLILPSHCEAFLSKDDIQRDASVLLGSCGFNISIEESGHLAIDVAVSAVKNGNKCYMFKC